MSVPSRLSAPLVVLLVVLPTVIALSGCSDDKPASQAVFAVPSGFAPGAAGRPCQLHQNHAPTAAYRGGPHGVTALELPFLASYTANGSKHYCDKKPPTTVDKEWARLYVELTGNSAVVAPILSG
jgi:hypothetical protein